MHPLTLSFFMDYKCNYQCDHCSVNAGPKRSKPFPYDVIKSLLNEGKDLGFKLAVFTGGEPTLDMDKLLKSINYAKKLGYITRVITNGWWAKTYDETIDILYKMKKAGLDELNTSFDDYHLDLPKKRWITDPLFLVNMSKATIDLDIRFAIAIIQNSHSIINKDFVVRYLSLFLGMSISEIEKRFKFVVDLPARVGRGKSIKDITQRDFPVSGCDDIGMVYGLHPDGRITVCCGHAIFATDAYDIGNWMTDETPLKKAYERASKNIIYWWIWSLGPNKILEKLNIKETTTHLCDACKILMVDHKKELIEYVKKHKEDILVNDILLNTRAQETVDYLRKIKKVEKNDDQY